MPPRGTKDFERDDMAGERKPTGQRQKQIIDAARKLIIANGSEHITIKGIAEEVGISEAAIYRHFKSKKDILGFLIDHIEQNIGKDFSKASSSKYTSINTIDKALRSHISAIEQRKGMSFQVIAEIISLGDKELNNKSTNVINTYVANLKDLLARGVGTKDIRADINLDAAATLLFCMIQGLVNRWALSNYSFNLEKEYLLLWNIFREAIKP
jgi:AcrR family transcriptional regulator